MRELSVGNILATKKKIFWCRLVSFDEKSVIGVFLNFHFIEKHRLGLMEIVFHFNVVFLTKLVVF
jgi:hypothetical protein